MLTFCRFSAYYHNFDKVLTEPETTSYAYDANGNLDEVYHSNGVVTDYVYTTLNQLQKLTHYAAEDGTGDTTDFRDNAVLANYEYQLNLDGSRAGVTETKSDGTVDTFAWEYDNLKRVVSEAFDSSDDFHAASEYQRASVGLMPCSINFFVF